MAANSKIEWTDHTINFWIGCTKVSPACDHCYAERDWSTDGQFKRVTWGPHGDRSPTKNPLNQIATISRKALAAGRRERVFVNSLSDWADNHKSITPEMRGQIFWAARQHLHLDFLLLTKRPQNIRRYLPDDWGSGYPNVWLGTTVEDQTEANRRIPHLLKVPARIHFVSCEPLLRSVDLTRIDLGDHQFGNALNGALAWEDGTYRGEGAPRLDWVICGGESGPGARPMHPDWARSLRDQCKAAGVQFHFKQWGEWIAWLDREKDDPDWREDYSNKLNDRNEDVRWLNMAGGCGFHGERFHVMARRSKAQNGRALDGIEHNGMPEVRS